jgi:hypothetical protein
MNQKDEMLERGRLTADLLHRFVEIYDNFRNRSWIFGKPFDFERHAKEAQMVRECLIQIQKQTFSETLCMPREHVASILGFRLFEYQRELIQAISVYEDYILFMNANQGFKAIPRIFECRRARKKYDEAVKAYQHEGFKLKLLWNEVENA